MKQQIMSLEVSVNHLMLLLQMHKRSIENFPSEYSESFVHGQRLILDEALPQLMEIQNQIKNIRGNQNEHTTAN